MRFTVSVPLGLSIWVLLAAVPVSGQIDSLKQALASADSKQEQLSTLSEMAAYYSLRAHDSTGVVAEACLKLARELKGRNAEVRSLITIGLWHHKKSRYHEAKEFYYQALSAAQQYGLDEELPYIYTNMGITYQREYQQDSTYYYYLKAEKAFRESDSPAEMWKVYNGLFTFFLEKGDTAQATAYARQAYEIVEEKGSRMDRGYLLFQLLDYFFQTGQFAQMAYFQEKWEAYLSEQKTSQELMETPEHIALFMFEQKDSLAVERQLMQAIRYFEDNDNSYRAGWCYEDLANFYFSYDRIGLATEAFRSALSLYQRSGASYRRGRVLFQLYQLEKEHGQPAEALNYLEAYKQLADSLAGLEVEESLNELKVRYETEKKEQALLIKELELDQKTQERNAFLASSVLLGLLALAIFLGLRQRLAINRRLASQESELQEQRIVQLKQEKRLSTMAAMIEGQEQERQRIANDLHDSLGGLLTSAKAHFTAFNSREQKLKKDNLGIQTAGLLDDAAVELRRISQNLMPRSLSLLGLEGALEGLVEQIRQNGLACRLQVHGLEAKLPQAKAVMLYRIVQELSNNVLKHADANEVLIQLIQHDGELHLIFEDDGKGFQLEPARQRQSLGMSSIESRVQFLRGELDIDTAPGQGTNITIRVPLGS